ncbi:helix-turn-helix transcriptional regulator [Mycobacterium deserti]|uniref:Helix-turn-helix transcriptional regulator n=1 Tax=Mycobacterium deserti TaxID=2978347 RepID=A0ABT2MGX6_9MYCO|nr:helix-turn-helix transcriptional regulator [Mycobacterium deserti]MCT7660330.1 helix-turn-helix transcriptional regulator [Mycobacterium deserti]
MPAPVMSDPPMDRASAVDTQGTALVRAILVATAAGDDDVTHTVVACLIVDAVDALIALGRTTDAHRLVELLEGDETQPAWTAAICARCRATILAHQGRLDAALAAAQHSVAMHRTIVMPFERGRAQLLLGQLLRRRRRNTAAAAVLADAVASFEEVDVQPWAERARAELNRADVVRNPDGITPTEQLVAELTSSGMTNREIAAQLFVSTKTVEVNLTRIYRKLGVRSRAQLIGYMSRNDISEVRASQRKLSA